MNDALYAVLLWSVIAWPLLLTWPALQARLPYPRYLAVIPALILVLFPGDFSARLPQILLGTGFYIDDESRWVLAMSVIIWLVAATVLEMRRHYINYNHLTVLYMLTLAGNLGIILSSDLVGFYCFSTIMGYGFYGMMVRRVNTPNMRAGYSFLIFFIVADLILFEAILLAALVSDSLQFDAVHEAMTETSHRQAYLWLTVVGFTLKTGIWPVHHWLANSYRSANPLTLLLLAGVPVTMALFGLVRWLPFGEHTFYLPGSAMQLMGIATLIYTLLALFKNTSVKIISARVTMVSAGLIFSITGTGLAYPTLWREYDIYFYPLLALQGIGLTMLSLVLCQRTGMFASAERELPQIDHLRLVIKTWEQRKRSLIQSVWQRSTRSLLKKPAFISVCCKPLASINTWGAKITLFLLFGLLVAWLAS